MRVENMTNSRGNKVKNQFCIQDNGFIYFQSYDSIIAKKEVEGNNITLDRTYWDYSTTTGRFRNIFLGENMAETRKKIASGEYKLDDLQNEKSTMQDYEVSAYNG
jgi:hypothetical protein